MVTGMDMSAKPDEMAVPADAPPETAVSHVEEAIPLSDNNRMLRKAAYGCGLLSFASQGISGLRYKNVLRATAGFGTAGITLLSLAVNEQNKPLPDKPLPGQIADSLFKPEHNTLFFNRSWSLVSNVLTLMSGVHSGSKKEALRGVWSMAAGSIEIAGLSDQDRREKRAESRMQGGEVVPEEERTFAQEIFANRWIALSNMAVRAGLMVSEGVEGVHGKMDKHRLMGGIFYCMAVASLFTDNYLVEKQIKDTDTIKRR